MNQLDLGEITVKFRFFLIIICLFAVITAIKCVNAQDIASGEDYPVIREMEIRILGRDYVNEDIYKRLDRLENSLFGVVSDKTLSDRVDALKLAIFGVPAVNQDSLDSDYSSSADSEENLKSLLSRLEKELMNRDYPDDNIEDRVSRLENSLFSGSADERPMPERIDRIASVINSKPAVELNRDLAQLKKYQAAEQGLTLLAIILMIVAGAFF